MNNSWASRFVLANRVMAKWELNSAARSCLTGGSPDKITQGKEKVMNV
jgi:hypothetical protein